MNSKSENEIVMPYCRRTSITGTPVQNAVQSSVFSS
jgi:hypothetical protein